MEDRINALGSIESYIGTFFSKQWVQKNVLNLSDREIDEMQKQINIEAGLDSDEGGVDVPDGSDGITRYPSVDGTALPADDAAKYQGQTTPEDEKTAAEVDKIKADAQDENGDK